MHKLKITMKYLSREFALISHYAILLTTCFKFFSCPRHYHVNYCITISDHFLLHYEMNFQ